MKKIPLFLISITLISGCDNSDIKKAKDEVAYKLRDPSSVQWRNVEKINDSLICGEYNAKNSYGAYSGFKRFAKLGEQVFMDDEKSMVIVGCDGEAASAIAISEAEKVQREINERNENRRKYREEDERKKKIIASARDKVKSQLKSPDKASFFTEEVFPGDVVCGSVNTQESMVVGSYIVTGTGDLHLYQRKSEFLSATGFKIPVSDEYSELKSKICKR